jgi:GNAT superfamily N-acetyltransferase
MPFAPSDRMIIRRGGKRFTVRFTLEKKENGSAVCKVSSRLPLDLAHWLYDVGAEEASKYAIVARVGRGQIVGFVRWDERPKTREIQLRGTYVVRGWRGQGLARQLWEEALPHFKFKKIWVLSTSRGGGALVRALIKAHPEFIWDHDPNYL